MASKFPQYLSAASLAYLFRHIPLSLFPMTPNSHLVVWQLTPCCMTLFTSPLFDTHLQSKVSLFIWWTHIILQNPAQTSPPTETLLRLFPLPPPSRFYSALSVLQIHQLISWTNILHYNLLVFIFVKLWAPWNQRLCLSLHWFSKTCHNSI